jgi:hypothetical protein
MERMYGLVHMYLRYDGGLLSLAVQPNNSQNNVCINCCKNDTAGIPQACTNSEVLMCALKPLGYNIKLFSSRNIFMERNNNI